MTPRAGLPRRTQRTLDRLRVAVGLFAIVVGALGLTSPAAQADPADPGSAVTVHGDDAFPNLAVTVSQTKGLTSQVVSVSWTGGKATEPGAGSFYADYLQIMQCWGDPDKGPDRSQCEFGQSNDQRGGAWTSSRQVTYGDIIFDKSEPLTPSNGVDATVPFNSVTGVQVPGDGRNQFYDPQTTNEIPYALTAADGTGQVLFETLSQPDAPGLGCGEQVYDKFLNSTPRPCFLVIVPRGETEVDGTDKSNPHSAFNGLRSSPLEFTNWSHKLVVPLSFAPLPKDCPLQLDAKPLLGDEMISKAIGQWGPALCTANPTQFPFVPGTDDFARSQLSGADPGMSIVGGALPADPSAPAASQPVYAPLAVNGLALAFYVTSQSRVTADPATKVFDGRQLMNINLTPRLVLKLISQSYEDGVSVFDPDFGSGGTMQHNAFDLVTDPDFQKVNPPVPGVTPDFTKITIVSGIGDAIMPSESSDAIAALWKWIDADPDAHAFLHGKADPWGMVINPYFQKDVTLPRSDFPKSDPYCREFPITGQPKLCVQDFHPFALTMDASAKAVAHGDDLASTLWDTTVVPPRYQHDALQPPDKRALLAITDVATAAHYGLPTAKLMNADKQFVGADASSMLASVFTIPALNGAPEPDPTSDAPGTYPLTTITYAATVPGALTKSELTAYAEVLELAASKDGQTTGAAPGQLALGYAPMPQLLRTQAQTVAAQLRALAAAQPGSSGSPPYSLPPGSSGGSGGGVGVSVQVPPHQLPGADGGTSGKPGGGVITPTPPPPSANPQAGPATPLTPLGWVRYVFMVLLVAGGALTLAGPLLRAWATKVPRRTAPSAVHPE